MLLIGFLSNGVLASAGIGFVLLGETQIAIGLAWIGIMTIGLTVATLLVSGFCETIRKGAKWN